MFSAIWRYSSALSPVIGADPYRDLVFRSIDLPGSRLTPGGVASRLISLRDEPVFILASQFLVGALTLDAAARASFAALVAGASPVTFIPGQRAAGQYPLTVDGVTVSMACQSSGVDVPAVDLRRHVLLPSWPTFSISSLVNRIGDFYLESEDWLVAIDQGDGGKVSAMPAAISTFHATLALPGVEILAVFESEGLES